MALSILPRPPKPFDITAEPETPDDITNVVARTSSPRFTPGQQHQLDGSRIVFNGRPIQATGQPSGPHLECGPKTCSEQRIRRDRITRAVHNAVSLKRNQILHEQGRTKGSVCLCGWDDILPNLHRLPAYVNERAEIEAR